MTIDDLKAQVDAIVKEYSDYSHQNDSAVSTGMARYWGAQRVAKIVHQFVERFDLREIAGVEIVRAMSLEEAESLKKNLASTCEIEAHGRREEF